MPTDPKKTLVEQTLLKLIEEIRMLVVGLDAAGNIVFVNPFFLSATGYSEAEVLGQKISDKFIPKDAVETFNTKLKVVMDKKYNMKSESPLLKKSGQKLYVDWNNFPMIENGKAIGILSVGVDTTSQVEMVHLLSLNEKTMRDRAELYEKQNTDLQVLEKALQIEKKSVEEKVTQRTSELNEEKARLLASINSFPYGFLVTDNDDSVVVANDQLDKIFDVKKVEWHLHDLRDILDGPVNFIRFYGLVKTSKQPYKIKDIDMGRKFLEIYIAPIFLAPLSDETIGSIILVNDITEQKIIERSKDEFLSIASHELRTPLTAIRGNAELIKKHYQDKINEQSFSEIVNDIQASSQRLIGLVNEFLNMSRLEQGKMKFSQDIVDVKTIIQDVIKELRASAEAKNLKVVLIDESKNVPAVIGDADRIREVLLNLVSNAITYTDKGSVEVKTSVANRQLKVTVKDTGKGIPLQNQNMLFRKFQQANENIYTRDASRSTGLGLYISKLMVEAMRGSIYLEESLPGKGSTFAFVLPVA